MAFLLPRKVFKQKRKEYYIPYISCKPCRSREGGDGGGGGGMNHHLPWKIQAYKIYLVKLQKICLRPLANKIFPQPPPPPLPHYTPPPNKVIPGTFNTCNI